MFEQKAKAINGKSTPPLFLIADSSSILKGSKAGSLDRLSRIYRRLNDVIAGMYTGVGCAGTLHEHHGCDEQVEINK